MTVVTFDVFSALIDSRAGGTDYFQGLARTRSWEVQPRQIYDRWDALNKRMHGQDVSWRPFTEVAEQALTVVYEELAVDGDPVADCAGLLTSMTRWPLWPDVTVSALSRIGHRLGLLSNIDEALLAGTAPVRLGCFDPALILTSELLRAYKPSPLFYGAATNRVGSLVHIASSARDVRGALEAGLQCVRLARPGHMVDPAGPRPPVTVADISQIPLALASSPSGT